MIKARPAPHKRIQATPNKQVASDACGQQSTDTTASAQIIEYFSIGESIFRLEEATTSPLGFGIFRR
jgi:hypothetical protein